MQTAAQRIRPRKHSIALRTSAVARSDEYKTAQYLTLHNSERYKGYHVRIGRTASLFFGAVIYGGMDNAFDQAIKYRDQVLKLLDEAEFGYRGNFLSKRNKSGHVGVTLMSSRGHEGYCAQWIDVNGKYHKKWFAIGKYGEEEALRLALEKRAKEVGTFPDHILKQIQELTAKVKEERRELFCKR